MSLLLALLLAAAPLEAAVAHYQAGELEKARSALEALLYPLRLEGPGLERDAHLLLAATYFALDDLGRAEEEAVRAFGVGAVEAIDPLLYAPDFQSFAAAVKSRQESRISALRAEREARDKRLEPKAEPPPSSVTRVDTAAPAPPLWSFIPFGGGQFRNGHRGKGTALAVSQGLCFVAAGVGLAGALSLRGSDGRYSEADAPAARALNVTYVAGSWCFAGLYGFSVVESLLNR